MTKDAGLTERDMDYVREKLRGAASDCNVSLEVDQVRYIASAVVTALQAAWNRRAEPGAEVVELIEAAKPFAIGNAGYDAYSEARLSKAIAAMQEPPK